MNRISRKFFEFIGRILAFFGLLSPVVWRPLSETDAASDFYLREILPRTSEATKQIARTLSKEGLDFAGDLNNKGQEIVVYPQIDLQEWKDGERLDEIFKDGVAKALCKQVLTSDEYSCFGPLTVINAPEPAMLRMGAVVIMHVG